MEGFIFVLIALMAVGFFFFVIGMVLWMEFFPSGKRWRRKKMLAAEIKRGLKDAEIYDGVEEEAKREAVDKYMREQAKKRNG